jgi:hypothetical protein
MACKSTLLSDAKVPLHCLAVMLGWVLLVTKQNAALRGFGIEQGIRTIS